MNAYQCDNCNFEFIASEAVACPRCSSKKLSPRKEKPKPIAPVPMPAAKQPSASIPTSATAATAASAQPQAQQKQSPYYSPQVLGDTKQAWIAQQTNEMRACPDCGGAEFEINWRRREKVCKKCGSIFGFKRNR